MPKKASKILETGVRLDVPRIIPTQPVELFGHVILVEGHGQTSFPACHALVALRDTPGTTVAVLTSDPTLQSLLETALATGNLIAFMGTQMADPPGGSAAWTVDVYGIGGVILYNFA